MPDCLHYLERGDSMPSAQVINLNPEPRTELTPLEKTLSGFAKRNRENQIEKQDTDTLRDIYGEYQRDGKNIENAMINIQTRPGLSPTARVSAAKQLSDFHKHNFELQTQAKKDMDKANLIQAKLDKEEADKAAKLQSNRRKIAHIEQQRGLEPGSLSAYEDDPKMAEQMSRPVKEGSKKTTPQEKYELGLATNASKEVPKLEAAIAEGKDVLSNIDTIEKIAKNELSGLKGYGKALFNTESAAQVTTLGASNLKSVIKLFNPVGALPTQKLNWIRNVFNVSPSDNISTIQGKLNTQRILANQALAREQERVGLLKKYYGNIPDDVKKQFDADTESLLSVMEEQYDGKKKEEKAKEERPGFVKIKAPDGKEKWVPEEFARQNGLI